MPSFEYDLHYLEASLRELEDYLLSKEIFWPLDIIAPKGEPPYPQMTLGNMLLAQARLRAYPLPLNQQGQYEQVKIKIEAIHSRWRTAWGHKAGHSFHSRLYMWRDFLAEYRENPLAHADRYPIEVRLRVLLQLLRLEAEGIASGDVALLNRLDSFIKKVLIPGDFIWEKQVVSGFPKEQFWFLYGVLSARISAAQV